MRERLAIFLICWVHPRAFVWQVRRRWRNVDRDTRDLWVVCLAFLAMAAGIIGFAVWVSSTTSRESRSLAPRAQVEHLPDPLEMDESEDGQPEPLPALPGPGYEENPCGGQAQLARITARDRAAREEAAKGKGAPQP